MYYTVLSRRLLVVLGGNAQEMCWDDSGGDLITLCIFGCMRTSKCKHTCTVTRVCACDCFCHRFNCYATVFNCVENRDLKM